MNSPALAPTSRVPSATAARSRPGLFRAFLLVVTMVVVGLAFPVPTALACRYSVRDTGFVDLGAEPYRLVLEFGPELTEARRTLYEQIAAAVLLDANVAFAARPAPASSRTRLALVLPDGRETVLAAAPDLPESRADIVALMERAVISPARNRLHDTLLQAYAVLVFVEGDDADANRRARRTLQEAIDAIAPLLPAMPKPVEVPPRVLAIPSKDVAAEAVLVAGLGMQPARVADPRVAVVFGRGRRVGEPLEGALITRTVLQDRLAIIGQDCECDLDRSSLQGPVIPARWDTSRQEAAARALGFDPENPLIRAEISRIVLKGPAKSGAKRNVSGAFDALALGYSEEPIDAPTTATSSAASSAAVAELPPAPGTREPEAPAIPSPSATPSGSRSRPETEPAPPSATARALGLWLALSGSGLVVATCGAWLLFRARKNRL